MSKASEIQVAGSHYKEMPIQPAEFCQRNRLNWCEANVVKYVCRHASKKGAEDIDKAIHYLQLLKEWEYGATEEHPFDLVAKGELPPAFGPMLPDGVTEVGAVRGEDGGIHPRTAECALFAPVCAGSDCNRCSSFTLKAELRKTVVDVVADTAKDPAPHPADLLPVFALIAKEHARSLEEHQPWDEAGHSPDTMLAVIKAELAEVELALSMGDYAETVKELVHVGNVAVKAIAELDRRGYL